MCPLIVCVCAWFLTTEASIVVTSSGPVRGKLLTDHGVSYYAYQAIPYAENPTGPLRFKPPVPKQPWSGVLDASKPGPVCPQPEGKVTRESMDENCLNINIFVPAHRNNQLLPVYVNVHGGTFKFNSGNIDIMCGPQLLLNQGIIYVSMNYRLGALGYLSSETEGAPGNAGLKDLLLALKWVKNNILHFGGRTITIGGQSSGAAMVHYLLLTDKTKGLFNQVILNSGSATNFRFLSRYPREHTLALANELGLSHDNEDNILQKLREASVFDIIDAQENIYKNSRNIMSPFSPFVPCIEKESDHAILTTDPIEIIKEGIPLNVPILAGINSMEGAFLWTTLHNETTKTLQEQFYLSIPADIEYPNDSDMYRNLINSVSELYFGDNLTNWTLNNFYDLLSDTQYTYGVGSWIKNYKERESSEKLYYYLFNFDGALNWAKINYNISFPGAAHSDEISYMFINKATEENLKNIDKRTQQTLDNMLKFMTNFIKFGNPTPAGSVSGLEWHLLINDQPAPVLQAPFAHRFAFWDNVYNQYYEYVKNGGAREAKTQPH